VKTNFAQITKQEQRRREEAPYSCEAKHDKAS